MRLCRMHLPSGPFSAAFDGAVVSGLRLSGGTTTTFGCKGLGDGVGTTQTFLALKIRKKAYLMLVSKELHFLAAPTVSVDA